MQLLGLPGASEKSPKNARVPLPLLLQLLIAMALLVLQAMSMILQLSLISKFPPIPPITTPPESPCYYPFGLLPVPGTTITTAPVVSYTIGVIGQLGGPARFRSPQLAFISIPRFGCHLVVIMKALLTTTSSGGWGAAAARWPCMAHGTAAHTYTSPIIISPPFSDVFLVHR